MSSLVISFLYSTAERTNSTPHSGVEYCRILKIVDFRWSDKFALLLMSNAKAKVCRSALNSRVYANFIGISGSQQKIAAFFGSPILKARAEQILIRGCPAAKDGVE